jgi:hypothetical protein
MNDIKNTVINFHGLVKNRTGPYKIVIKCKDGYVSMGQITKKKEAAHDYTRNNNCFEALRGWSNVNMATPFAIYLMTSAGDIELTKNDFVKGMMN